jgi:hypothetical protein
VRLMWGKPGGRREIEGARLKEHYISVFEILEMFSKMVKDD